MKRVLTALFGVLVAVAPAAAQDHKPVDINIGFGWAFPSHGLQEQISTAGWNGTIGATFNINPHLGIQADTSTRR